MKYVITKWRNTLASVLFHETEGALEISAGKMDEEYRLGNIYLAQVTNIVKNIKAAFVSIAGERSCYLSLSEQTPYILGAHGSDRQLCIGDYVVVQLVKEDIKTKQPSVSAKLSLSGKYLVLLHGDQGVRISQKITDKDQRELAKQALLPFTSDNYMWIVRTNAFPVSETTLQNEAKRLLAEYNIICTEGIHKARGALLYQSLPWYIESLRDLNATELTEVITDEPSIYEEMHTYLAAFQPEDQSKLRFYEDANLSLASLYSFERVMKEATEQRVWLKSGAFLLIEPTETMTVIDVNTGKSVSNHKQGEALFLSINREAATECMRQLRLRNISGMIMIDFINMTNPAYNMELMQYLSELAKRDRIPVSVVDMTGLKLVELTRKKEKKPLHEVLKGINIS